MNVTLYPNFRVESHIHVFRQHVLFQSSVGAQDAERVDSEKAAPVEFGGR